ncbi:DUF2190 domain-containing protein [Mycobacterium vulneris]|nr:DUF2190 domain-containing protein [Mycolicibacterium vulneris]OCB66170.1 DUF2190 domain-containing protein [Mycolicibacterium vulneris]
MANEMHDIYDPGRDITGRATAAVTGKRFLKISGNRTGGNIAVAPCAAGDRSCGVAKYDAASGDIVGVARGNSRVVRVTAGAALAAGDEVQAGAGGVAIVAAAGAKLGYALTAAANGADAEISLY